MRWIIGDIHGMLRPLEKLLEAVSKADGAARFFFVGDYINRGPDSRGVIDLLLTLPAEDALFIRGNHDDIFDLLLNGKSLASGAQEPQRLPTFIWFLGQGLDKTLQSYGVGLGQIKEVWQSRSLQTLVNLLGAVPQAHREFIARLPAAIQEPDFFIVHATWDINLPDRDPPIEQQLQKDQQLCHMALWGRFSRQQIGAEKSWQSTGFFGHTPVVNYLAAPTAADNVPLCGPRIVLMDTAAAYGPGGRLTAYCVEEERFIQADSAGRLLKNKNAQ